MTPNIEEAKNFYPFATLLSLYGRAVYNMTFRVVNGISIRGHFDAKMEIEVGGVKGAWMKFALWMIRRLEEIQRKIQ